MKFLKISKLLILFFIFLSGGLVFSEDVIINDAVLEDSDTGKTSEKQVSTLEILPEIAESEAVLAKKFKISLILRYPSGWKVYFPENPLTGSFTLINHDWTMPVQKDGHMEEKHTLEFLPVRLGLQKILGIEVPFVSNEGHAGITKSKPVQINVKARLVDEANPSVKSLPQPVSVMKQNELLIWGLIIAGAVMVTALTTLGVVIYIRRRRERNRPPPKPLPAHVTAFNKLNEIAELHLIEKEKIKQYYILVSDVIRQYFGHLLLFDSLEMTTTELLKILKEKDMRQLTFPEVQDFVEENDFVKFAKYRPKNEEVESLMQRAHDIVTKSMRIEEEPQYENKKSTI